MNKTAIISLAVFLSLLALVFVTRESQVSVGMRSLDFGTLDASTLKEVKVSFNKGTGDEAKRENVVLKKSASLWTVSEKGDKAFAVDENAIEQALKNLESLEAKDFVTARKEKHADLEIDDAKGQKVTLVFENKTLDLLFGRFAKGGGNFVRLASSDEVFVGRGTLAGSLKKDVKAWRKRKLLNVEAKDLRKIIIQKAEGALVELKASEGEKSTWRMVQPERPEAFYTDEAKLSSVASALTNLRATDFADSETLGTPRGSVSATDASGKTYTIQFGQSDDQKRVYTKVSDDEQLYLLNEYTVNSVLKSMGDFRDLAFAGFDASKVVAAEFRSSKGLVKVEKKEGVWGLSTPAPSGFDFDATQVEPKLASLSRLKASGFLSGNLLLLKRSTNNVGITLTLDDGAVKTVFFGDALADDASQVVAQGARDPSVYKIAKFQKERYANALELFKRPPPRPAGPPGAGAMQGLDQLPPELRRQLMQQMQQRAP